MIRAEHRRKECNMGIRELREKYATNLKGRQAVNAAIRAELIGGNQMLDALSAIDAGESITRERPDTLARNEIVQALQLLRLGREAMANEIACRYGLAQGGSTDGQEKS